MSYTTQSNLVARYGEAELLQLTDREGTGDIDAATVTQAIADADAEIDRYLTGRYALPLAYVPDAIERASAEIARYFLFAAQGAVPEIVKDRYAATLRWLELLGKGTLLLAADLADAPSSVGEAEMTSSDPLWNRADGSFV